MPRAIIREVDRHGTRGGIKLLSHGRKYANDFLKMALPGRFIVAVALRESENGGVEPAELEFWLGLIEALRARHPHAAFVMLNCLPPSQWREWSPHVRFARHAGLSLQDAICLAQIADGYLGVLDLSVSPPIPPAAPGSMFPLEDGDLSGGEISDDSANGPRIMVASRDRADIEAALGRFSEAFPLH